MTQNRHVVHRAREKATLKKCLQVMQSFNEIFVITLISEEPFEK